MSAEVSHGRGGAGNIGHDATEYVDGEVVRTGVEGSHGDGAYSSGRGGAGNIGDVGTPTGERKDKDIVPEAAVRMSQENGDFHTGRGGAGNEHLSAKLEAEKTATTTNPHVSLADKLKARLMGLVKRS